jgi:hypothetical protein
MLERIKILLVLVLIRAMLELMHVQYVDPLWLRIDYGEYVGIKFNIGTYLISWLMYLLPLYRYDLLINSNKASSYVARLLILIGFMPFTALLGLGIFKTDYIIAAFLYWALMIILFYVLNNTNFNTFKNIGIYKFNYFLLIFTTVATLYVTSISSFRIDLNIFHAYDYRDEARSYTYSSVVTYLLGLSRFLLPLAIFLSILNKQLIVFLIYFLLSSLSYSFDGGKTLFLLCLLSILLAIFYRFIIEKFIEFGALFVFVLFYLESVFFTGLPLVLIIRRVFLTPQLINSYVYESTVNLGANYYSQLLRFVGMKNDNVDINYYVGLEYFSRPQMSANSGMFADAYWQLGTFGIIISPLLIIIYLMFFDLVTASVDKKILVLPAFIISYYLNNSGFVTSMFSHGLLTALVCFIFFGFSNYAKNIK